VSGHLAQHFCALTNCWVDWLRAKSERERLAERVRTAPAQDRDAFEAADLRLILQELPAEMASAIVLYYYQRYTLEEIAEVVGSPVGTLKWRLSRARRILKGLLGDGEEGPPEGTAR
jgi:RNA polymerase sigma-70 factor, ECF subfamily